GGLSGNGVHAQSPLNEVEPNNTPAAATPLDLSSGYWVVTGSILPVRDVDYYSFSAPAGSRVWITVDTGGPAPLSPTNSGDSLVTLLGSNGSTVLEEDDDDGSGNGCDSVEETGFASAIAGRLLVEGGTYFIRVTEFADDAVINPYRLLVVVST